MSLVALILDSRPAYLRGTALSLLQMPLGANTVMQSVLEDLLPLGEVDLCVTTDFAQDGAYADSVRRLSDGHDCEVLIGAGLADFLGQREPSDWVIVVDPAVRPLEGLPLKQILPAAYRSRLVTHFVAAALHPPVAHDRLLMGSGHRVRRIQRYYAGTTQVERHQVAATLLPAAVVHALYDEIPPSVTGLREGLVRHGLPSQDTKLPSGAVDIGHEGGLLQYMEWQLSHLVNGNGQASSSCVIGNGTVHPDANIYGPVVVDDDATIESGAIVIGPAVISRGSRLGENGVLIHGILAPGATVLPGDVVHRRVMLAGVVDGAREPHFEAAEEQVAAWESSGSLPPHDDGRRSLWYPRVKLVVESALAAIGLLLLSPLFIVVAIIIKLTSPGPVFFGHNREGLDGREFRCWKFRTMVPNAHAMQRKLYTKNQVDGPQFKMDHDPRITAIGRWLRLTNIDELPQLFNVMRGEMSLIGPRPSPFRENQICVPWRRARLSVRPGITGLWQVCRHERSAGDFHQWIHYDMMYVRHMSAWLDLKIILFTFLTLAGRWSVPTRWLVKGDVPSDGEVPIQPSAPILESSAPPPMPSRTA